MSDAIRRQACVALLLAASGCAALAPDTPAEAHRKRVEATRPAYNLAGYPPAVRDGYIDGCETAKHSRYAKKDASRFASDPQYKMGWDDGFSICKK